MGYVHVYRVVRVVQDFLIAYWAFHVSITGNVKLRSKKK